MLLNTAPQLSHGNHVTVKLQLHRKEAVFRLMSRISAFIWKCGIFFYHRIKFEYLRLQHVYEKILVVCDGSVIT